MRRRPGFTLVELLVVMALIGSLSAIAVPRYRTFKERGYQAVMRSDLGSMRTAEEAFWTENMRYSLDTAEKKVQKGISDANCIADMDTTFAALRSQYLEPAGKKLDTSFHSSSAIKRAVIIFFPDMAGLQGDARAKFCKQADCLPTWMLGGNNSACRQAYNRKTEATGAADYKEW